MFNDTFEFKRSNDRPLRTHPEADVFIFFASLMSIIEYFVSYHLKNDLEGSKILLKAINFPSGFEANSKT
jgi:hypothetical protein